MIVSFLQIADFDNSKPEFTVGNESMDVSQWKLIWIGSWSSKL